MIARLLRWLFPPDCDECGAHDPRSLLGSYWHADTCSYTRPQYPTADDE